MCFQFHLRLGIKNGHEIFDVRNDHSACYAHEGETGIESVTSVGSEELKKFFKLSRPGVEPLLAAVAKFQQFTAQRVSHQ